MIVILANNGHDAFVQSDSTHGWYRVTNVGTELLLCDHPLTLGLKVGSTDCKHTRLVARLHPPVVGDPFEGLTGDPFDRLK